VHCSTALGHLRLDVANDCCWDRELRLGLTNPDDAPARSIVAKRLLADAENWLATRGPNDALGFANCFPTLASVGRLFKSVRGNLMAHSEIDPITGKRKKSGGRQIGTPNRTTSARYAAMARVNEALAAIGEDTLTGMKLLKEVLNHKDTPLDVKIQCAGLLIKQEQPTAEEHKCVAYMPPAMPGKTQQAQMALWWALYGDVPVGDDPDWDNAVKTILERIPTKQKPETL
jgi:hypothetical protein